MVLSVKWEPKFSGESSNEMISENIIFLGKNMKMD